MKSKRQNEAKPHWGAGGGGCLAWKKTGGYTSKKEGKQLIPRLDLINNLKYIIKWLSTLVEASFHHCSCESLAHRSGPSAPVGPSRQ